MVIGLEYYILLKVLFSLWKKRGGYWRFDKKSLYVKADTAHDIYYNISLNRVFIRLYSMLQAGRKLSYKPLLYLSCIYLFQIPFILLYFLYQISYDWDTNLNKTLCIILARTNSRIYGREIVIYENKIYLNGQELQGFVLRLKSAGASSKVISLVLHALKKNENELEVKVLSKEYMGEYGLLSAKDKTPLTHVKHPTLKFYDNTYHATSNTSFTLHPSQTVIKPFYQWIKPSATDPGTVVTQGGILGGVTYAHERLVTHTQLIKLIKASGEAKLINDLSISETLALENYERTITEISLEHKITPEIRDELLANLKLQSEIAEYTDVSIEGIMLKLDKFEPY